jgi:hypothetical protein
MIFVDNNFHFSVEYYNTRILHGSEAFTGKASKGEVVVFAHPGNEGDVGATRRVVEASGPTYRAQLEEQRAEIVP